MNIILTLIASEDVLPVARRMKKEGKQLVAILAHSEGGGSTAVTYDYYAHNTIERYEIRGSRILPSISGVFRQAGEKEQFIERELNCFFQ